MKYWRELFSTGYINHKDGLPDISSNQSSMIVSLLSAGTFFGALGAAPVADYFGRRIAMILECFVFCFGVILQTAATSIPLFVAGRFFAGLGVGLLSATSKFGQICMPTTLSLTPLSSPSLSVRDSSQVDSRYDCWCLPAGHHLRSLAGCHCQQLNQRPQ